jgi:hypothetical protein
MSSFGGDGYFGSEEVTRREFRVKVLFGAYVFICSHLTTVTWHIQRTIHFSSLRGWCHLPDTGLERWLHQSDLVKPVQASHLGAPACREEDLQAQISSPFSQKTKPRALFYRAALTCGNNEGRTSPSAGSSFHRGNNSARL